MPNPTPPDIDLSMSARTAKVLAWIAWAFVLIGLIAGAVAAFGFLSQLVQQVAAGISVIALIVAAEIRRRLPSAKAMASGIVGLLLVGLLAGGAGCGGNLAAGYRTVVQVRNAGEATGKTLAGVCKLKRLDCRAKHDDLKSDAGKACLKTCHEALRQWVKHVMPAVNTALAATYAGLETAYIAGKRETSWLKLILPGACALTQAAEQWEPIAPGRFKVALAAVASMKGLVCK